MRPPPLPDTHVYRKVRDRASYAFAMVAEAIPSNIMKHRNATWS